MTLCSKLNPKQGKTLGLANMVANFGFIIGPLLVGFILSFSGDLSISFKWIALAGTLFALPILYRGISSSSSNKSIQIIPAITCTIIIITALTAFQQNSTFTSNQNQEQDNIRPLFRYTDVAMGTIVNLTLQTTSEGQAEKAALNAIKAMRSSQKDFDHRNKMGSIGRINRAAGIKAVKISDEAFKLIKRSLQLGIQTNGTFDISIGAITTTDFYYVLDDATLNKRRSLVDYKLVEINPEKKSVKLPRKRMALDVGGLAKGTIIDAATDSLKDAGIEAALVEAGGDFNTYGDRIWTIGIKDPRSKGLLGKIEIKNQAVCGSGDYYQFITTNSDNDEARRHHILDPSQMRSSHESIATTAIGPTAETADALATTIFIMGPEAGTDFINKFYPDCSAMWVMPDKSIRKTSNFPALVTSKQ
jgi:thiamine biosynthesis lipoprotein